MQSISLFIRENVFLILLLLGSISCGSHSPNLPDNNPKLSSGSAQLSAPPSIPIPIPDFIPEVISIIPKTYGPEFSFGLDKSQEYSVLWIGTFDKDGYLIPDGVEVPPEEREGKIIAQSRIGTEVEIDGKYCDAAKPGLYTFTTLSYAPFDDQLVNELAEGEVKLFLCAQLKIEEVSLPDLTNDGKPERLRIRVRLEDKEEELYLDEKGERPPVKIILTPSNGVVGKTTGTTDSEGYFETTATLTENLGTFSVEIEGEYAPNLESPQKITANDSTSMRDPCNSSDSEERSSCPSPTPDPSPSPTPSPTPDPSPTPTPPSPDPTPTPPPCDPCDVAYSWGDPHVVTFGNQAIEFQPEGEFILSRSRDGSFLVQVRQKRWKSTVSINTATALEVGNHTVEIYAALDPILLIDGEPIPLDPKQIQTYPFTDTVEEDGLQCGGFVCYIIWPTGEQVKVEIGTVALNLYVSLPPHRQQVEGVLMYPGASGLETSTQEVIPLPLTPYSFYKQFADSWRIPSEESLFSRPPAHPFDFNFPHGIPSIDSLTPEERARGEQLCQGVPAGALFDACVIDAALLSPETGYDPVAVAQEIIQGSSELPEALPVQTTLTVTSPEMVIAPNDGCSLKEAIQAANTNQPVNECPAGSATEPDIIDFAVTHLNGGSSQVDITSDLEIRSSPQQTIELTESLIISINQGSKVTIEGLSLNHSAEEEGGLSILNYAELTLNQSRFTGHHLGSVINNAKVGILAVTSSHFTDNQGGNGAAIETAGQATITNSHFENNTGDYNGVGGAIYQAGSNPTPNLVIDNSTFIDNIASRGGAISNAGGNLTVTNSSFTNNHTNGSGGAISSASGLPEPPFHLLKFLKLTSLNSHVKVK